MMGILLFIIARILQAILCPFLILYAIIKLWSFKAISDYFYQMGIAIDQFGNVAGSVCFNDILITNEAPLKYGNPNETISHVTGVNYLAKEIKPAGKILSDILDSIDRNHVEKAAKSAQ